MDSQDAAGASQLRDDNIVQPPTEAPEARAGSNNDSEHAHDQGQPVTISAQSLAFVRKVEASFGPDSRESATICAVLKKFSDGQLSKRETHRIIVGALGNRNDLKIALMNILDHQDADWGPGDFDLLALGGTESAASTLTSPDFLQPQHEPKVRLPSMSVPWQPGQYVPGQQTGQGFVNPAQLRAPATQHHLERSIPSFHQDAQDTAHNGHGGYGGYDGYDGYATHGSYNPAPAANPYNHWQQFRQRQPSSPAPQLHNQVPLSHHHTSPYMGHPQGYSPYAGHSYGMRFSSPAAEQTLRSYPPAQAWGQADHGADWPAPGPLHQQERFQAHVNAQHTQSPLASNKEPTPQLASPYLSSPNPTPSMLGTPTVVPLGQSTLDTVPQFKRDANGLVTYDIVDKHGYMEEEPGLPGRSPPPFSAIPPFVRLAEHNQVGPVQPKPRPARKPGQFIHTICGKAFATLRGVKRHHFGGSLEDPETKTGCWAKNNKPNIEWDEHPTCKQEQPPPQGIKRKSSLATRKSSQATPFNVKAPVVPGMIPSHADMIPGFPTLHELPKTVAETLQANPAPPGFSYGETIPYHTSRPPTRSNMDSLLTAVNVAAKIDAPKPQPQGRNDSVISNLDAQVNAAEHSRAAAVSNYMAGGTQVVTNGIFQGYPLVAPSIGLGTTGHGQETKVPLEMMLPSQADDRVATPEATSGKAEVSKVEGGAEAEAEVGTELASSSNPAEDTEVDGTARRTSGRKTRSDISRRERKMLGLSVSPSPAKKKQKL